MLLLAACSSDGSDQADAVQDLPKGFVPKLDSGTTDKTTCDSSQPHDISPDSPYVPPVSFKKQFLTRRGAHSYLEFPLDSADGPLLHWRHYSDIVSHLGIYSPLLQPMFELESAGQCVVLDYAASDSHVQREVSCGTLHLTETTLYIEAPTVAVRLHLKNGGEMTSVAVSGRTTGLAVTTSMEQDPGLPGVRISLNGEYIQLQKGTSPVTWAFAVSTSPPATSVQIDPDARTWSFQYDLGPMETKDIVVTFEMSESEMPAGRILSSPVMDATILQVEQELDGWLAGAPEISLTNHPTYALSWNLFWENTASPIGNWISEAVTPSKRHYFRGVWLWDSAFHALALARGNAEARALARKQIELFVMQAMPYSHLPREIWTTDISQDTQPPGLMTWASLVLADEMENADDGEGAEQALTMLQTHYPAYTTNHNWFLTEKDSDGDGLCEWKGPDSGWDTSPRWDHGLVEALDLACWLYLDALMLAQMAEKLGKPDAVVTWNQEAQTIAQAITTQFWHNGDGFFYDLRMEDNAHVKVMTPAAFLPLLVGAATQQQAEGVAKYLHDEKVFATPAMLPTVAAASPDYQPGNYWRGPVWIVLNAMTVWGLNRYGLAAEADELKSHTLGLIENHGTTYEYYNSQTGQGSGAPGFMWTGAFYVMLRGQSPIIW